jgi:hypothetical protein
MATNSPGINFTTKNYKALHQARFSPLLSPRKNNLEKYAIGRKA